LFAYNPAEVDTDQSAVASCPLREAYHFSYVNNSGGACVYPASYVRPCASLSRLRFYFRQCPSAAYTHDHGKNVFNFSESTQWSRSSCSAATFLILLCSLDNSCLFTGCRFDSFV